MMTMFLVEYTLSKQAIITQSRDLKQYFRQKIVLNSEKKPDLALRKLDKSQGSFFPTTASCQHIK